jgi:hypothetical protein
MNGRRDKQRSRARCQRVYTAPTDNETQKQLVNTKLTLSELITTDGAVAGTGMDDELLEREPKEPRKPELRLLPPAGVEAPAEAG